MRVCPRKIAPVALRHVLSKCCGPLGPHPLGKALPRFVFEAAKRLLPGLLDTFSPIEHSIRNPAKQARRIFHQHLLLLILIHQPAAYVLLDGLRGHRAELARLQG